jgi:hypothetical protein
MICIRAGVKMGLAHRVVLPFRAFATLPLAQILG